MPGCLRFNRTDAWGGQKEGEAGLAWVPEHLPLPTPVKDLMSPVP